MVSDEELNEMAKLLIPRLNALADGEITLPQPKPVPKKKTKLKAQLPTEPWEEYIHLRMGY